MISFTHIYVLNKQKGNWKDPQQTTDNSYFWGQGRPEFLLNKIFFDSLKMSPCITIKRNKYEKKSLI